MHALECVCELESANACVRLYICVWLLGFYILCNHFLYEYKRLFRVDSSKFKLSACHKMHFILSLYNHTNPRQPWKNAEPSPKSPNRVPYHAYIDHFEHATRRRNGSRSFLWRFGNKIIVSITRRILHSFTVPAQMNYFV